MNVQIFTPQLIFDVMHIVHGTEQTIFGILLHGMIQNIANFFPATAADIANRKLLGAAVHLLVLVGSSYMFYHLARNNPLMVVRSISSK